MTITVHIRIAASRDRSGSWEISPLIDKMNIGYLHLESDVHVRKLQQLLDGQSDGLMNNNGRLLSTSRKGIGTHMKQLESVKLEIAKYYKARIKAHKVWLKEKRAIKRKVAELEDKIFNVESKSDEANEILELQTEVVRVQTEITELKSKLEELKTKKKGLIEKISLIQSTVESKSSSYIHELDLIKPDEAIESEIEIRERELEALKDQEQSAIKEANALNDGVVVWKDCCEILKDLEKSLALLSKLERSNSNKIIKMLTQALQRLERNYDIAEHNKWSLLSVAIGQEVEALKQGVELVESRLAGSKLTNMVKNMTIGESNTLGVFSTSAEVSASASTSTSISTSPTTSNLVLFPTSTLATTDRKSSLRSTSPIQESKSHLNVTTANLGKGITITNINSEPISAPTPTASSFTSATEFLETISKSPPQSL